MYFQTVHQVEFRDTDAAGIAHFSVFFNWMERTEHRMLRYFHWSVVYQQEHRTLSWPRVATSCDFRRPLKFEHQFGVELYVKKLGRTSATYDFRFIDTDSLNLDPETTQRLMTLGQASHESWFAEHSPWAEGTITAVCCHVEHGKKPIPVEIPTELRQHLESLTIA